MKYLDSIARFLYDLLVDPLFTRQKRIHLLFVCAKADHMSAYGTERIQNILEAEMYKINC